MKITIKTKISINVYTIIFLLSLIVMLYYFLPITASVLTASMMFGIIVILYFLIVLCNNWKKKQDIISNLLLICTMVILFFVREYYKDGVIGVYTLLLSFFPIFLVALFINRGKYDLIKKLAFVIFFSLAVTGVTTFLGLAIYPELARDLATFNSGGAVGISIKYNIGGFDIVYCVVLSIPLLCLVVEKRMRTSIKNIIKLLIFFVCIIFAIKSQYTIALLLGIVSCGLIIVIRKFSLKRLCIFAVLGILLLSLFKNPISNILVETSRNIESQSISQRLEELSKALNSGTITGEDMTERGNAYGKSVTAFVEHPITGTWITFKDIELGGHSTILDLLAGAGVILFFLVLYTFYYIIKLVLSKIEDDITKKYVGIFLMMYIALAIANPIISGIFFSILFIGLTGVVLVENR